MLFNVDTHEPGGANKMKFMHHCGYLVRDRLPISTREWMKKTNAPHISFVSNRDKTLIWNDVLEHFALQIYGYGDIIDGDELKERVRDWAKEDGHPVLDLEETPIHNACQEEHSTRFHYPKPDIKAEALLG